MEKDDIQVEKKRTKIAWHKQRGMRGCLVDGWRMVVCDWKGYMRRLWAVTLAKALCAAFFVELVVQYVSDFALPAFRLWQSAPDSPVVGLLLRPDWATVLYLLLAGVLLFVLVYLLKGKLYETMHFYARRNSFDPRTCWGVSPFALHSAYKSCVVDALMYVPACLLLAACLVLLHAHWGLCLSLCTLIVLLLWSMAGVSRPLYAFYGLSLASSVRIAFRKEWHRLWPLRFIVWIFVLAVAFVCLLSPVAYLLTKCAGADSVLMGDPTGIPSYVPLLFFFSNAFSFFLLFSFTTVAQWPVVLMLRRYEENTQPSVVVDADQGRNDESQRTKQHGDDEKV